MKNEQFKIKLSFQCSAPLKIKPKWKHEYHIQISYINVSWKYVLKYQNFHISNGIYCIIARNSGFENTFCLEVRLKGEIDLDSLKNKLESWY